MRFKLLTLLGLSLVTLTFQDVVYDSNDGKLLKAEVCDLPQELLDEIASYQPIVDQITNAILNGELKGTTYSRLAEFLDKFGPRLAGSQVLEDAIDYLLAKSQEFGLENVRTEDAVVSHWVR